MFEVHRYWRGKLWQIVKYGPVRVILNDNHPRVRSINR